MIRCGGEWSDPGLEEYYKWAEKEKPSEVEPRGSTPPLRVVAGFALSSLEGDVVV